MFLKIFGYIDTYIWCKCIFLWLMWHTKWLHVTHDICDAIYFCIFENIWIHWFDTCIWCIFLWLMWHTTWLHVTRDSCDAIPWYHPSVRVRGPHRGLCGQRLNQVEHQVQTFHPFFAWNHHSLCILDTRMHIRVLTCWDHKEQIFGSIRVTSVWPGPALWWTPIIPDRTFSCKGSPLTKFKAQCSWQI